MNGPYRNNWQAQPPFVVEPLGRDWQEFKLRLTSALRSRAARAGFIARRYFLIVTPWGLDSRIELLRLLDAEGIKVLEVLDLTNWPARSTLIYMKHARRHRLLRAFAYERLWRAMKANAKAECWILDSEASYARLIMAKRRLRSHVKGARHTVVLPSGEFHAHLHAFHVPDPEDLDREGEWVFGSLP